MRGIAVCILLFTALLEIAQAQPSRDERWREDIHAFFRFIQQTHPDPYRNVPSDRLTRAFEDLAAQVPQLTDYQIALGINRAAALMRDAHTAINASPAGLRLFPLRLRPFTGGWYATEAHSRHNAALGKRLLRIQGTPMEDVIQQVAAYIPHEVEPWVRANASNYLVSPEFFHTIGLIADRNSPVTYEFESGISITVTIEGGPLARFPRPAAPNPPLFQRHGEYNYWFQFIEAERLLYIKYNVCQQDAVLPMREMALQAIAATGGRPVRIVMDIRNNAGGNSAVSDELFLTLGEAVLAGRLQPQSAFGIIGRATFSSGMLAAMDMRASGQVVLVGETIGGRPASFGEVRSFVLPNSRLNGQSSSKEFLAPNLDPFSPDLPIDYTIEDWAAQRDPYLEAILRRP